MAMRIHEMSEDIEAHWADRHLQSASFHIPTSSRYSLHPSTLISDPPVRSQAFHQDFQAYQVLMVAYLLSTSQPLDSIQPAQENQSMIWAFLSLKRVLLHLPKQELKICQLTCRRLFLQKAY